MKNLLMAALFLIVTAVYANAQTLTFDDINTSGDYFELVPSGYGGFSTWSNLLAINKNVPPNSGYPADYNIGYANGAVSGSNSVFNNGGTFGYMINYNSFNFLGAYFTAAHPSESPLFVQLYGYDRTPDNAFILIKSSAWYSLGTTPTFIAPDNFTDIDAIAFDTTRFTSLPGDFINGTPIGRQFVMDDFSYEYISSPVPEPSTIVLLCTGLAGVGIFSRKRRKA